ncbi:hypothetical protein [Massilia cavernae]|uniref:Uncharacterized protein n=1 Tax=Massilia cavernae TaxID=2320864 RepID=A0A418XUJ4_9BURK|nr:hypothetical protein [Massilia cavernae]RJG16331.1 hypothetical protein D3872_11065 [Massilia cavernae]
MAFKDWKTIVTVVFVAFFYSTAALAEVVEPIKVRWQNTVLSPVMWPVNEFDDPVTAANTFITALQRLL